MIKWWLNNKSVMNKSSYNKQLLHVNMMLLFILEVSNWNFQYPQESMCLYMSHNACKNLPVNEWLHLFLLVDSLANKR